MPSYRTLLNEDKGNASGEQLSHAIFYSPCYVPVPIAFLVTTILSHDTKVRTTLSTKCKQERQKEGDIKRRANIKITYEMLRLNQVTTARGLN